MREYYLAMIQIGFSFWAQTTHEQSPGAGGGGGGGGVALKADFSDLNANEAWVFW